MGWKKFMTSILQELGTFQQKYFEKYLRKNWNFRRWLKKNWNGAKSTESKSIKFALDTFLIWYETFRSNFAFISSDSRHSSGDSTISLLGGVLLKVSQPNDQWNNLNKTFTAYFHQYEQGSVKISFILGAEVFEVEVSNFARRVTRRTSHFFAKNFFFELYLRKHLYNSWSFDDA